MNLHFFYENLGTNYYDLNINQYLIIKDRENDSIIDTLKKNGTEKSTSHCLKSPFHLLILIN